MILTAGFEALGVTARVHGSLAWQHVTGEDYLRPRSDIDVLIAPETAAQFEACLQQLIRYDEAAAPGGVMLGWPKLDGEVLFPDGRSVAWRELAGPAEQMLTKEPGAVTLTPRRELQAAFSTC